MAGDHEALDLRAGDAIDLGYATDFHILLRAIDEALPGDATLYLEGREIAPAVRGFLRSHASASPREVVSDAHESLERFHLPLAGGSLGELREIAEDHLRSEVARHLAVYGPGGMLLRAPNAGDGIVSLATALPDATIERFRDALGSSLRRPKRRSWLFSRPRDD